jgi:uncharacterized protein YqeY
MQLVDRLQEDTKQAMISRDELKLSTLRFLLADMKNYKIEKQRDLTDEDVVSLIERQVKRHRESIEGFEKGGRVELADKERKELEILQSYLPEQLSNEEIKKAVEGAIASTGASSLQDMGKVMGALAPLRGKADFSLISQLVKEKLA